MAATAQLRHTQGMDARGWIRCGAHGMGRVTARTRRHLRIIGFLEEATVGRGGVLGHLVHWQRRIVALHELRIAMTVSATPVAGLAAAVYQCTLWRDPWLPCRPPADPPRDRRRN